MTETLGDWLDHALRGVPRETAVEAAYYVVRELKQRLVPMDSRKDHLVDANRSQPSEGAVSLASQIAREIVVRERSSLNELSGDQLHSYIRSFLDVIRQITDESLPLDHDQGRALLDSLRQS